MNRRDIYYWKWDEILASGRDFAPPAVASPAATKGVTLEEKFDGELSKDWFWGLGTWTAKDGVLRGFQSGPRRHGPVKMRRLPLRDGSVECEFRLEGKVAFAGVIFGVTASHDWT